MQPPILEHAKTVDTDFQKVRDIQVIHTFFRGFFNMYRAYLTRVETDGIIGSYRYPILGGFLYVYTINYTLKRNTTHFVAPFLINILSGMDFSYILVRFSFNTPLTITQ